MLDQGHLDGGVQLYSVVRSWLPCHVVATFASEVLGLRHVSGQSASGTWLLLLLTRASPHDQGAGKTPGWLRRSGRRPRQMLLGPRLPPVGPTAHTSSPGWGTSAG